MVEKYANSEHALCVLNHRGDLDWMIGWVLIERIGMLGVSSVEIMLIHVISLSLIVFPHIFLTGYKGHHEGHCQIPSWNRLDFSVHGVSISDKELGQR